MIKELKESIEKVKEINKEKERIEDEVFSKHLSNFCKEKKLFPIVIFGYTPSFNDGDPCTHTQNEVSCGESEYQDYIYDEELIENLKNINNQNLNKLNFISTLKEKENNKNVDNTFNEHLNQEEISVLRETLSWLHEYFERNYHTDFRLTIYFDFKEDKLVVEKELYEVD